MNHNDQRTVSALLERAGGSYAGEVGIVPVNRPAPLFQLLMFAQLASTRIAAPIAVAAVRELLHSGYRTPKRVADADWQDLVDALDRARYVRYDESNATRLRANAALLVERWHGDLRRLATEADHDPARLSRLLQQFQGIGPVGADIFLREVQDTWIWLRPYFDDRARRGAKQLRLPTDPAVLAQLSPPGREADLAAALVRVTVDHQVATAMRAVLGD